MAKPTLGLCMIIKDEFDEVTMMISELGSVVDEFYICCTGKQLLKISDPKVHITKFEWNDNFASARNSIKPKTDYWMWADADDQIELFSRLPELISYMQQNKVDMMSAEYIYKFDPETRFPSEIQTRERIIRTSLAGEWHGAVHETWIPAVSCEREETAVVSWVHHKTEESHQESMQRNRTILEREYKMSNPDPRIAHYLGLNYMMDGHYVEAISCFNFLIENGGWDEERYRAWLQIGTAYYLMNHYDDALNAFMRAILELPDWPDAYFNLQQVYWELDQHQKSLEWAKVGFSKPEPETQSARNPIVTKYQPVKFAAYSELACGDPAKAARLLASLHRSAPRYPIEDELITAVANADNEHRAINAAKELIDYNQKYEGDALAVLNSLPATTRAHLELTDQRRELIPGRKWPKGSIVFWCGQSYEPWGPDTMDKGMGGSEESVVQLSRKLAKLGHEITVYNERESGFMEAPLYATYLPWTDINPNDEFDVFIAWRNPSDLPNIKARLKLCDLHDTMSPEFIYQWADYVDKYMVKSQWHRNLYPELPDDKFVIVGNGIVKEQFK